MNKYRYLILLILLMSVTCGFNWGFAPSHACTKAKTLMPALTGLSGEIRTKQDLMKEGVDLFPKDPNSHYKLGVMYDFRKDYDSAIAEYQLAISLKSDYAKALNSLGKTYLKTGKLDKAKGALEAAKKADPNLFEPRELLSSFNDEPKADSLKHLKKKHHKFPHPKKSSKIKNSAKNLSKNDGSLKKKRR
jgi:tetratricopeptide (TPR) repeat protein